MDISILLKGAIAGLGYSVSHIAKKWIKKFKEDPEAIPEFKFEPFKLVSTVLVGTVVGAYLAYTGILNETEWLIQMGALAGVIAAVENGAKFVYRIMATWWANRKKKTAESS